MCLIIVMYVTTQKPIICTWQYYFKDEGSSRSMVVLVFHRDGAGSSIVCVIRYIKALF